MSWSCFGAFKCCKRKDSDQAEAHGISTNNVTLFSYNSLRSATRDFHPSNQIGAGAFGVVYRGSLRDGTQIAIKCLSAESKQGTNEFLTEINMIWNIRHPNLVQLIGCCVEDNNRILVYEYLENNSLANALLGSKSKYVFLGWPTRANICLGTASGLSFLHEEADPPIVHRDIKASNVLLDGNFHPKIGDFGLAKLFPDNVTHVSTRVAGTMGYLAPEYALLGQLTKKADVYSFGVLLLEIISGRSSSKAAFGGDMLILVEWGSLFTLSEGEHFWLWINLDHDINTSPIICRITQRVYHKIVQDIDDHGTITHLEQNLMTWKLREEGRLLEIVDPELTQFPEKEVMRFIKVALFCTQAGAHYRPTMKQVVEMLSKEVHLNEKVLTEPGVYKGHTSYSLGASSSETSSSQKHKGKQSVDHEVPTSAQLAR